MAIRIQLPSAGLLGITGVQIFRISADTTLVPTSIYILEGDNTVTYTLTLPATANDGEEILLKRTGDATVGTASALIEGVMQTIEITNNQPIRLIFVSASYGWLIA